MRRVSAVGRGGLCASFGAGLLAATCFPNPAIVVIAAVLLILCGIAFCR
ncbi:MAG: hypothetical protein LBQ80_00290 [Clostridium sp.]|nr:hypothetical protein [Clostridium sp.]